MENLNTNNPIQPINTPPNPHKWYHHKGALAILGLIIVIVGLAVYQKYYLNSPVGFALDPKGCGSAEAQKVVAKKDLQAVRDCQIRDIQVDGKQAKLVSITYGAGMDCPSGCIYNGYVGFLLNDKLVDFQGEPEIYPVFTETYGDWCNVQNRDVYDNPQITKAVKSVGGQYHWSYQFSNFDNQSRIKSLLETSLSLKAKDNPQYCILNGEMVITEVSYNYAKKVDFSNLNVQFKPIAGAVTKSTEDLVKECDNKFVDGYKIERWECIEGVAIGKNDPLICNNNSSQDAGFIGSCMRAVAVFSRNPNVCDTIGDYLQKNQCYENVAAVMKDVSICERITDTTKKNYCIERNKK